MMPRSSFLRHSLPWLVFLVCGAFIGAEAHAQLISLKTAPVATGSQFQRFPSKTRGMGGVTIAASDSLRDAFVNPVTAARFNRTWVFSAPTYYTVTDGDGAARTLSVGAVVPSGRWFAGGSVALQHLDPGPSPGRGRIVPLEGRGEMRSIVSRPAVRPLRETAAQNQYVSAFVGRSVSEDWTLAGSVDWAGLDAVDGVELLYPGNQGLEQDGYRIDARLGVLGSWQQQSLMMQFLYNRLDMAHDVWYRGGWPSIGGQVQRSRLEEYVDRTNTYGLHLEYVRMGEPNGWRVGAILTGNLKTHPKIPNYDLMNIPRDPGTSWAYDVGMGVSRSTDGLSVGIDLIVEPIFSETWANAQEPLSQPDGGTIEPGERSIENDFTFANSTLRVGMRPKGEGWDVQFGTEIHTIRYWMTQSDYVEQTVRDQYEAWSEWRVTWGSGFEWDRIRVRYTGYLTLGTGQPGVAAPFRGSAEFAASSSIIVAPRGPLTLQKRRVFTHQVSVSIPLQGGGD